MRTPTDDSFRALARSAPWLFRTLHFTRTERGEATEAWLSRPGRLAVRTASGERHVQSGTPWNNGQLWSDGAWREVVRPYPLQFDPPRRADGLVAQRPDDPHLDADDPIWGSYTWVAMLDPFELASHTGLRGLTASQRHGRLTWWAYARALDGYQPRCGCCPLLWGAISERDEGAIGGPTVAAHDPNVEYPDEWLVGLDAATGVVVDLTPIGGSRPDSGFTVTLHEVDAALPDSLFA